MNRSVLALVLAGCSTLVPPPEGRDAEAERFAVQEGSPDGLGLLGFVNDPSTTLAVLDDQVKLDHRAATGIIAHRDGPDAKPGTPDDDKFGTVAELDAVYYVGDSALTALLTYASAHGWVATDPDDVLGRWDDVTFTLGQADAVLDLVNTATYPALDVDAGLDKRAVDAIFAARPVDTLPELAGLSYVGTSALEKLQDYVAAHASEIWSTADLQHGFAATTPGILFPSESDFPLDPVLVAGAFPVDADDVKDALGPTYVQRPEESSLADRAIEVKSVDEALGFLVTPADWWSDDEVHRADQWRPILDIIDHLDHPQVFRFGDQHGRWLGGSIDVYVIGGSAEGDLVGFHTISVET